MGQPEAILTVEQVHVSFGGVSALNGVSFVVPERGCVSLVGPNGAGKTTVLNAISGMAKVRMGQITFGEPLTNLLGKPPHVRARLGIARTFQNTRFFEGLTLLEQLVCGAHARTSYGLPGALIHSPHSVRVEGDIVAHATEVLAELDLSRYASLPTARIPGALRRLGDIGRALMSRPRLLLLDEIAAGLTFEEKSRLVDVIRRYQSRDKFALLLIEHDLEFVRALAKQVVVLVEGRVLATGATDQILSQPEVLTAYVGDAEG
jgi:branched-chain amino acid transport system ATP-binding protein